jgi:hypothetical protein
MFQSTQIYIQKYGNPVARWKSTQLFTSFPSLFLSDENMRVRERKRERESERESESENE